MALDGPTITAPTGAAAHGYRHRMDRVGALEKLDGARTAVLATVQPGGRPHTVPVVFARIGNLLVSAVDHKPKRTTRLQRLTNIRAHPQVSLLAHEYREDWSGLWWVRADGTARILEGDTGAAIEALVAKYAQYRDRPPEGPVIAITIGRVVEWTAAAGMSASPPHPDRGPSNR